MLINLSCLNSLVDFLFPIIPKHAWGNPEKEYTTYKSKLKKINQTAHVLGEKIGIKQSLTTYVMRHAWATQALQLGIDVVKIKDGLGHDSLETTQSYLEEFDNDVIDEMNDLITE